MKPYKLSLIQGLINDDKVMRSTFCESMPEMVEDDETLFLPLVFRDKATFHGSGKVSRHNLGTHHPHEALELQRDPLK